VRNGRLTSETMRQWAIQADCRGCLPWSALPSPVPESEGPGPPSLWFGKRNEGLGPPAQFLTVSIHSIRSGYHHATKNGCILIGTMAKEEVPTVWSRLKAFGKIAIGILFGAWLFACAIWLYDTLDSSGYFAHRQAIDLYLTEDWVVGEHRNCSFIPERADLLWCVPPTDSTPVPHNMTVSFHGRISATTAPNGDRFDVQNKWTCTRESDGFVCNIPKE
jgi:hypothetical protein